ncbi:GNAT family N-acetyltransferase [Clostridium sp. D2Q-14]|uniref:GNAT family N-acetyltransferase n=1 Tax=Anaeromonas gelatinilytica TaxID=2683194 RepID=UPI00193C1D44|nr:GNAT family N-acetyltransferase [Anaeromonas gelatinilytica]MBS4536352.1 GNAT family N-acetyltransferase [Anaeromonas gelatinilytica]
MLNHKGTKVLETERLILRPFKEEDAIDMYNNWATDKEVTRYVTWPPHKSIDESKNIINLWIEENKSIENYHWAIEVKEDNSVIGTIGLLDVDNRNENSEIGYCISRDYWNKGITTEAFLAIIEYAFNEVGFTRITARYQVGNNASGRVMEKCGLTYEGTLRKILKNSSDQIVDCKYYSILREEVI